MAKNPYTLLGVSKSASEADIRKAYRALAKKLHPDVNPNDKKAEERFKEVTAAYNLLTNKELRAQYDSGQVDASGQQQNPFAGGFRNANAGAGYQTGFGGMGGMGGGQDDMADLFSSLFGMNMSGRQQSQQGFRRQTPPQKGADVRYKLNMSLPDALAGGVKDLGNGLKVKFPKGIRDGQSVRLRGKGKKGVNGGSSGDAKVKINVQPHKSLTRDGDTLRLNVPISLHEALNGAKVEIDMPTGKVSLSIPAGTNSGRRFRLKGKGVGDGDLIVTPQIVLTDGELAGASVLAGHLPDGERHDLRKGLI